MSIQARLPGILALPIQLGLLCLAGCGPQAQVPESPRPVPAEAPQVSDQPARLVPSPAPAVSPNEIAARTETASDQSNHGKQIEAIAQAPTPRNLVTFLTTSEAQLDQARHQVISQYTAVDAPLNDVLAELQKLSGVRITLDTNALDSIGLESDLAVSIDISRRSLDNILSELLPANDLTWTIHNDSLWVTTPEGADELQSTRLYDVSAFKRADIEKLTDLLTRTISPASWEDNGGPATMYATSLEGISALVVRQGIREHDHITAMLMALLQFRDEALSASPSSPQVSSHDAVAALRQRYVRALGGDPARDQLVRDVNSFAIKLFRELGTKNDDNLVFSPLGISAACGMLHGGAANKTATEIKASLEWHLPAEQVHPAFQSLLDATTMSHGTTGEFRIANRVWGADSVEWKTEFSKTLRLYSADLILADMTNSQALAQQANSWIGQQSHDRLHHAPRQPSDLQLTNGASPAFLISNVVYLEQQWRTPFSEKETKDAPFQSSEGEISVPTMRLKRDLCRHANVTWADVNLQVLEKGYESEQQSLVLLLPSRGTSLRSMLQQLDSTKLETALQQLERREINLYLPRVSVRGDLDLAEVLKGLGMQSAWEPADADFSAMSDNPLYLARAWHSVNMEIDEKGMTAAAATILLGGFGGFQRQEPLEFRVDRPFALLVVDKRTNCIVFMGQITNPQPEQE